MLDRIQRWWARRLAYKALLLSLNSSPETWDELSELWAKKGTLIISVRKEYYHPIVNRRVDLRTGADEIEVPFWMGRRIQSVLKRAVHLRTLRSAVASLKPQNTPLQIAQARSCRHDEDD